MTEPMTRLMAAVFLHLAELPDRLRLDQAARLLSGDDKAARMRWIRILDAAVKVGELPTQADPPPAEDWRVTRARDSGWLLPEDDPRSTHKPVLQIMLPALRGFLERHHESIPPWLVEVPAAPSLSTVRRKAALKRSGYTEDDVSGVQAAVRAYCEKAKTAGHTVSISAARRACPVRKGKPAPEDWVRPIVQEIFPEPAKGGRPKKPKRPTGFSDLARKLSK